MADQVFLFYGDEDFLIQEKISELKKGASDSPLSIELIDGESPDLEKIVAALQTPSLLLGEKLLIIKKADLKDPLWERLVPALEDIPAGTRVVFWASVVDRRAKIFKLLDRIGEVCEFKPYTDWEQDQVVSWVLRRARSAGMAIEQPAALRLQEICGNTLSKLASEIDKLAAYVGDRRHIEKKDVEALASPGEMSVFVLSDAIAEKNLKESLSAFSLLQKNKVEIFPLLAMLANRYRIMLLGKSIKDPMKIAQTLKASPYYVRKCLGYGGRFTAEELKKDLELILGADLKLKSGEPPSSTIELLLADLCGK